MGLTRNPYANFYMGTVTAGGTDGTPVSETYQTTLTASNLANDTVLTVASVTGFVAGMDIIVGSETKTISSIAGLQITLSTALGSAHSSGETVKSSGAGSAPITLSINGAETAVQTAAVRCQTGYQVSAGATITPIGTNSARWALSLDGTIFAAYGAAITLSGAVGATNTLFYYKAKPLVGDTPQPDLTVEFQLSGTISAV